jgi:hypothetical protein
MHPVGGGLCLRCSGEDGARMVFQKRQPRRDVGGVVGPRMMGDAEIGEDEASRQFGGDLFDAARFASKPCPEIAIKARHSAGRMDLMPISA